MENDILSEQILQHLEIVLKKRSGDLAHAIGELDRMKGAATGHLAHYLAKRSYEKAWILLKGGDPEKGICH